MFRTALAACTTLACTSAAFAQDVYHGRPHSYGAPIHYGAPMMSDGGQVSVGHSEPLFAYDDPEPWKHGYLHILPYYEGLHSFRPANYKQVFAQSQTAAIWGMPNTMPYSQQFWHRYEQQADLSRRRTTLPPTPAPGGGLQPSAYSAARSFPDPPAGSLYHPAAELFGQPTYTLPRAGRVPPGFRNRGPQLH